LTNVRISSAEAVLRAGRYVPRALSGKDIAGGLTVGADGRIKDFVLLHPLTGMSSHILELEHR